MDSSKKANVRKVEGGYKIGLWDMVVDVKAQMGRVAIEVPLNHAKHIKEVAEVWEVYSEDDGEALRDYVCGELDFMIEGLSTFLSMVEDIEERSTNIPCFDTTKYSITVKDCDIAEEGDRDE